MKVLVNLITLGRIAGAVYLLFLEPLTVSFFLLYALCGVTDMLDGFIARKTGNATVTGAMLDSMADLIFFAAVLVIFIPILPWKLWIAVWICLIAACRFTGLYIGFMKFHKAAFLHTVGNKVTGAFLFAFPILYLLWGMEVTAAVLCGIASLSAAEELLIAVKSNYLDRDIAGYWKLKDRGQ